MNLGSNINLSDYSRAINLFLEATLENGLLWNSIALEDIKIEYRSKKEKMEMVMKYEQKSKEILTKELGNMTMMKFNKPQIIKNYLNRVSINKKTVNEINELRKEIKRVEGRINKFKFINFEEDCFFVNFKNYRENYRFTVGTINDSGICVGQFDYIGNDRGYYERSSQLYSKTGSYINCFNSIDCPELITLRLLIKNYINKGGANVGIPNI